MARSAQRGRGGMPGAQCTRSLVRESSGVECARVFTASSPETPGIPTQWLYGLWRTLPGDRAFLSPSPCGTWRVRPVGFNTPPQDLTPASRRQDHTLLPYATRLRQNFAGPGTGPSNSGAGAKSIVRLRAVACSQAKARPASRVAPDAAASTASRPASVTTAIRPLSGTRQRWV
jgi:hypothetical protein